MFKGGALPYRAVMNARVRLLVYAFMADTLYRLAWIEFSDQKRVFKHAFYPDM